MPNCIIVGCKVHSAKGEKGVSFYRLPAIIHHQGPKTKELSELRRLKWLTKICRDDIGPDLTHIRVCNKHFCTGKPAELYRTTHVDWAPTLKLSHPKVRRRKRKRRGDDRETEVQAVSEPKKTPESVDRCCQTELTSENIKNCTEEVAHLWAQVIALQQMLDGAKQKRCGCPCDRHTHGENIGIDSAGLTDCFRLIEVTSMDHNYSIPSDELDGTSLESNSELEEDETLLTQPENTQLVSNQGSTSTIDGQLYCSTMDGFRVKIELTCEDSVDPGQLEELVEMEDNEAELQQFPEINAI